MLTQEERKLFQEKGYSFEEIQKIEDSHEAMERWELISEEEFFSKVYDKINNKMKEKCIK